MSSKNKKNTKKNEKKEVISNDKIKDNKIDDKINKTQIKKKQEKNSNIKTNTSNFNKNKELYKDGDNKDSINKNSNKKIPSNIKNNIKTSNKNIENKSKAEEIVFKDIKNKSKSEDNLSKNNKKEKITFKEKQNDDKKNLKVEKKDTKKVRNNINTKEFFENKQNKKRKILFILFIIFIILVAIMCFSTIFAILGSFKITIARGVKINGIDVSNLTYNEAKQKMIEVMDVELTPDIELVYNNYNYTIKISDIDYKYNLTDALEKAYNVGKSGNIVQNNYSLIKTAILGEDIYLETSYDIEALNAIIDIVDTNIPGRVKQYSYYIEDSNLIINPGTDGVRIKINDLKEQIISSIQNRNYNNILDNYDTVIIEIPYEKVKADIIDISKISEDISTEPQNAYYVEATETTDFKIYPAKDGIALAISLEEAQQLVNKEEKSEYIIPLNITKAEIQLKDIGVEAFPYEIQKFSTRYDASNYSRSKNLEIAASKINGTVLMPGEIFSFNNVVGERTVAEGYQNAKIYSNGQVVDGLAGGICQISSTLYNVVLLSNLEIVERYNHSFTTSYVAAGRDATVVYGIKDFKFKNNRNYPIKIEATVANGIATFSIYGIEEDEEYVVKIIPKTTQTIPYTTQTITDTTLEPGTMKVTQSGASGCKVTTYKELYLNGTLISSEIISNDVYQVMTRIIRANPMVQQVSTSETNNIQ